MIKEKYGGDIQKYSLVGYVIYPFCQLYMQIGSDYQRRVTCYNLCLFKVIFWTYAENCQFVWKIEGLRGSVFRLCELEPQAARKKSLYVPGLKHIWSPQSDVINRIAEI